MTSPSDHSIPIHLPPDLLHQVMVYQAQRQFATLNDALTEIVQLFFTRREMALMAGFDLSSTMAYLEDVEDEPDEILYDFLPDDEE